MRNVPCTVAEGRLIFWVQHGMHCQAHVSCLHLRTEMQAIYTQVPHISSVIIGLDTIRLIRLQWQALTFDGKLRASADTALLQPSLAMTAPALQQCTPCAVTPPASSHPCVSKAIMGQRAHSQLRNSPLRTQTEQTERATDRHQFICFAGMGLAYTTLPLQGGLT